MAEPSFKEIQAQIATLAKKAEAARAREVKGAIADAKKIIALFGLTAEDLDLAVKPSAAKKVRAAVQTTPKYRDPESGKTWTGHGKPPNFIKNSGKPREAFLIPAGEQASTVNPAAAAASAPAGPSGNTSVKKAEGKAAKKKAAPARKAAPQKKASTAATPQAATPAPVHAPASATAPKVPAALKKPAPAKKAPKTKPAKKAAPAKKASSGKV